jgi:hypothetical protein
LSASARFICREDMVVELLFPSSTLFWVRTRRWKPLKPIK